MRLSESPFSDGHSLVNEIAEVLADECDLPYAIFGHSMGAVLAYELALRLRDKGLPQPECLFLSGRIAAHLALRTKPLHKLPLDQFLAELEVRYGGLPRELLEDQEMLDFYLPILRADLELIETHEYRTREPLNCPIVVTAGENDQSVWREGLLEWKRHTTGDFDMTIFEGGHFYLSGESRQPFLKQLQNRLTAISVAVRA
jgi:surfactin synthase thioesterase subunit